MLSARWGSGNDANGLRGDANHGTGGVFTSSQNNGLFGITAHRDMARLGLTGNHRM
jgi:hypothetical protein